jgi:repressor LexA
MPQSAAAESHILPIVGEIAAGGPIEAYQDASESMAVPDLLAPSGDAYVLRVRGDSMINAHIQDGDFVLIRPQQTARDGDIVVAQVEENAVTLKQFFKEAGRIRLQPANDAYPAMFYNDVRIQGKLIGVIRRLDWARNRMHRTCSRPRREGRGRPGASSRCEHGARLSLTPSR